MNIYSLLFFCISSTHLWLYFSSTIVQLREISSCDNYTMKLDVQSTGQLRSRMGPINRSLFWWHVCAALRHPKRLSNWNIRMKFIRCWKVWWNGKIDAYLIFAHALIQSTKIAIMFSRLNVHLAKGIDCDFQCRLMQFFCFDQQILIFWKWIGFFSNIPYKQSHWAPIWSTIYQLYCLHYPMRFLQESKLSLVERTTTANGLSVKGSVEYRWICKCDLWHFENCPNYILKHIKRMINPLRPLRLPNFYSHELSVWYPKHAVTEINHIKFHELLII